MFHKIIEGDCRDMSDVPSESIELVFTSPPYFNVKRYDENPQNVGNIQKFDDYMKEMEKIFKECYRVLKDGCFCIVNISDIRSEEIRYNIPSYYSILLSSLGFKYKEDIIWEKFVIVTDRRFGVTIQHAKPRMFYPNNIYEHTFVFLKGDKPREPLDSNDKVDIKYLMDNKFNNDVWHIAPDVLLAQFHEAPFPIKYAELVIKLFSSKGETVLDPFLGAGTTMLVSKSYGRNSIGFEINPEYVKLIKERVGFNTTSLMPIKHIVNKQMLSRDVKSFVSMNKCSRCGGDVFVNISIDSVSNNCEKCGLSSTSKKNNDMDYNEVLKIESKDA